MDIEYTKVTNMDIFYWSVRLFIIRYGYGVKGDGYVVLLFKPAASITLLEYMKIWCNTKIRISNKQNTMFVCSVIVLGYITEGWDV